MAESPESRNQAGQTLAHEVTPSRIGASNGVTVTLEELKNGSHFANRSDWVSLGRYTMRGGRLPGHPCDASNPATHAVSMGFRPPLSCRTRRRPERFLS